MYVM